MIHPPRKSKEVNHETETPAICCDIRVVLLGSFARPSPSHPRLLDLQQPTQDLPSGVMAYRRIQLVSHVR